MRAVVAGCLGALAMAASAASSPARDADRYPDWSGQWTRAGSPNFDPSKPPGKGQRAPLTAEAQAAFDKVAANRAQGGLENSLSVTCVPNGMPRVMIAIEPMVNLGKRDVYTKRDNWTIATQDGAPSAHFEHTIVVRTGKAEILSTFEWIEQAMAANKELVQV